MTQSDDKVGRAALSVAARLWNAEPGELAAVRRMDEARGAPLFWRMAARNEAIARRPEPWAAIARMLALLTPTGDRPADGSIHDGTRPLGAVLCDGGKPDWPGERPVVSEKRLARLLASRGAQRRVALERAVRMLARTHPKLNVPDLAWAVLNAEGGARIARDYYARLDRAEKKQKDEKDV